MSTIDRKFFWDNFPFRPVSQSQIDSINFILDKLDASEKIDDLRKYAYVLATIKHETAETYKPIKEYGGLAYLKSKRYYPFFGRGYVQLTWDYNYKNFNPLVQARFPDKDIVANPDRACEPEIAWVVLEEGMTRDTHTFKDLNFTGYTLEQFFNDTKTDWVGARKIINGTDCANLIAGYAKKFYDALQFESEEKQEPVNEQLPDKSLASVEATVPIVVEDAITGEAHKAIPIVV